MSLQEALELLNLAPGLTHRAMFGGFGFYSEGRIFGIMDEGIIYLKGDDKTVPHYEEKGGEPFTYLGANGPASMKYYKFPTTEITIQHLSVALEVAHRAPLPKPKRPRL
jgi:DNA transformation protein and related proteins